MTEPCAPARATLSNTVSTRTVTTDSRTRKASNSNSDLARLLFITDFTEQFAYRLLRGIIEYAGNADNWVVCRMPPAYKNKLGFDEVVKWAKQWKADVVMACDDNQGSLLLEACNSHGIRIPDEVAVIGVDNDEVLDNLSNPSLSSIDVDIEKGGFEAAAMAVKMMEDPDYAGEDIILHPVSVINRMSTSVFATTDKEVVKALQFISRNVENKILVPDILKEVPLSRRLLETRFKKVTGYTIYSYISRQRIEHFAELLLRTNDSVSEIAAKMDEPDTKSICRRFKAIKGCTPTEYRERELRKLGV